MIEKTLYRKHYDRVHDLWERACLGFNIRTRWCRRRHVIWHEDAISKSLYNQCQRYYKLLGYLKEKGIYT